MSSHDILPILPKNQMRILLLGPGNRYPRDHKKRVSILKHLRKEGYVGAMLGEDLAKDRTDLPFQVRLISSLESLDLVLVLNSGTAPIVELSLLWPYSRAREIARVWCPRKYIEKRRSVPGDVVKSFDYRVFSNQEFNQCALKEEFLQATNRECFNIAQRQGLLSHIGLLPPNG